MLASYAFADDHFITAPYRDGVEIIGYNGSAMILDIPSTIDGEKVVSIGEKAFSYMDLEKVYIPSTVIEIKKEAFENCIELEKIDLSQSIVNIGERAFANCTYLSDVILPATIENIGEYAFQNCAFLYAINIPISVQKIGRGAFKNCSLMSAIELPVSLLAIESETFEDCINLRKVSLPNRLEFIGSKAFSNCISLRNITLPDSLIEIDSESFSYSGLTEITALFLDCKIAEDSLLKTRINNIYVRDSSSSIQIFAEAQGIETTLYEKGTGSLAELGFEYEPLPDGIRITKYIKNEETVIIPDEIDGKRVKVIGSKAFFEKNLKHLVLSNNIEKIEFASFMNCHQLEDVSMSEHIQIIEKYAFKNCRSLNRIEFPQSLNYVGNNAFEQCFALTVVQFENGSVEFGELVFGDCAKLEMIHLPMGMTTITFDMFRYCNSLKELAIPDSVTMIDEYAFIGCKKLQNIDLPTSVTSIKKRAFADSGLKSITIPDSVVYIDTTAIPQGVTVRCAMDSYAYTYAETHGLPVELTNRKKQIDNENGSNNLENAVSARPFSEIPINDMEKTGGEKSFEKSNVVIFTNDIKTFFSDDNGNALYPIEDQNGTAYVPLLPIADLLGIKVEIEKQRIKINGVSVAFVNEEGEFLLPVQYENNTYVPLFEFAKSSGLEFTKKDAEYRFIIE